MRCKLVYVQVSVPQRSLLPFVQPCLICKYKVSFQPGVHKYSDVCGCKHTDTGQRQGLSLHSPVWICILQTWPVYILQTQRAFGHLTGRKWSASCCLRTLYRTNFCRSCWEPLSLSLVRLLLPAQTMEFSRSFCATQQQGLHAYTKKSSAVKTTTSRTELQFAN